MSDKRAVQKFLLGTAVKISTIISIDTADTALITIDDPTESEKITDQAMTKDANKSYSYIWQSATTDMEGDYIITLKITKDGNTSVKQGKFTLAEQT